MIPGVGGVGTGTANFPGMFSGIAAAAATSTTTSPDALFKTA